MPLIAETAGQNALVADSSALAEQVVADVLASAFDSAGQRCSALRILCLQEDVADRTLAMLRGAMAELAIGNPGDLATDIGPVITAEARDGIEAHVAAMRERGHAVTRVPLGTGTEHGTFVPPTLIEIARIADVEHEVFGPVLHVLRFPRAGLDRLIGEIDATGYGLTFGLHTRIDETVTRVVGRIGAGNVYVNRNVIGAVVGVQPFGGSGLSGTGPKAGGPLYLGRLLGLPPQTALRGLEAPPPALATARAYVAWLQETGHEEEAERCLGYLSRSCLGASVELAGPVGERNTYGLRARGGVALLAADASGLLVQLGAVLATGNVALVARDDPAGSALHGLPAAIATSVAIVADWRQDARLRAVLVEGDGPEVLRVSREVAALAGPIVSVQAVGPEERRHGADYDLQRLLEEWSVSTNTAAAGGNASLMSIG